VLFGARTNLRECAMVCSTRETAAGRTIEATGAKKGRPEGLPFLIP